MPRLIILRGPMGSGKSKIGEYLRGKLEDSAELNLDLNADSEIPFIDEVLGKQNVIGELYDGGSHTSNPTWINKFREKGYDTLSVILEASLETCLHRVLEIRKDNFSQDYVKGHYNNFHQILKPIFKERSGIHEISVDANYKQPHEIGDEILEHIMRYISDRI